MAKKEVYKVKPMTEGKRNIIAGLLQEYDIQSAEDIQEALIQTHVKSSCCSIGSPPLVQISPKQ